MATAWPRLSFPTDGFSVLNATGTYEEERLPFYQPENFYPVKLGQVFKEQYQIVSKVGYGTQSTVWLCRDLAYVSRCSLFLSSSSYSLAQYARLSMLLVDQLVD